MLSKTNNIFKITSLLGIIMLGGGMHSIAEACNRTCYFEDLDPEPYPSEVCREKVHTPADCEKCCKEHAGFFSPLRYSECK